MKRILAFIIIALSSSLWAAEPSKYVIELKSMQDYDRLVTRNTKPVVIDFYATWCGPCQRMAPLFNQLAKEYDGRVQFVKVDTGNDALSPLVSKYNIRSIPTFIFKKGQMAFQHVGSITKSELKRVIDTKLLSEE